MNTQHFKYAIEVEKTGSITQAADNLYMGQPSLSKAIRELEDRLGITIFKRTSKGVVPTQKGAEFLRYAKDVLAQVRRMEALRCPSDASLQRFSASLAGGSYIAQALGNTLAELDGASPLMLEIAEASAIHTIRQLADGRVSLGVIRYQRAHEGYFADFLREKGLRQEIIWTFDKLVAMHKTHPLADEMTISADALAGYAQILYEDTDVPYSATDAERAETPDYTRKTVSVQGWRPQLELLGRVPGAYAWVSPVSEELLEQYDLVQRKCVDGIFSCHDALIYPQNHEFSTLEKRFVDRLYEARNQVALKNYC